MTDKRIPIMFAPIAVQNTLEVGTMIGYVEWKRLETLVRKADKEQIQRIIQIANELL